MLVIRTQLVPLSSTSPDAHLRLPGFPPSDVSLSVWCIRSCHSSQLRLPLVSITQQLFLVVQQLFSCLRRILCIRALHDCVHRTRLLAVAAVDALGHVNVVSCRPPAAVLSLFGFDGNGLGRTYGLTELASDAALFACRVASEGVLATETG